MTFIFEFQTGYDNYGRKDRAYLEVFYGLAFPLPGSWRLRCLYPISTQYHADLVAARIEPSLIPSFLSAAASLIVPASTVQLNFLSAVKKQH